MPDRQGAKVIAEGLSLKAAIGWVYHDITFSATPGTLTAVEGETGSGRTSLLLTLAGRMVPTSGRLEVDGLTRPRKIQEIAALGILPGVNDLESALSVREHLRERLVPQRWARRRTRAAQATAAMHAVGLGDLDLRTLVRDLDPMRRCLLGVALGLLDDPRLLLADQVGEGLALERRELLWDRLRILADDGLTVIASCSDAAPLSDLDQIVRTSG